MVVVLVPVLVKPLAVVRKVKTPVVVVAYVPASKVARCLFYRRLTKTLVSKIVFAKEYAEVNISQLNRFEDGATVDPVALIEMGILKNVRDGIRILGNGTLEKKLTVIANGFTKTAEEKIVAAGGKVEVI